MAPTEDPFDIEFFWDPVCPFAWITSRWVEKVAAQRDFRIDWRFISLRLVNKDKDYATEFPPEYEAGHTAGLRLLRVAARVREEHGQAGLSAFYEACGGHIFERGSDGDRAERGTPGSLVIRPSSSSLTIIPWTAGGVTRK